MNKDKRFKKILYTKKQIEEKILELATWVNKTYQNSDNLILIGLLKGSIPFLAQLIKDIKIDHTLDFMVVSSYDGDKSSSGNVKIVMDLKQNIVNRDVLIVEDIIDSGITLKKVKKILKSKNPKTLKILTLLNKEKGRKIKLKADKIGFEVPDCFLAGFGLDVNEKLRNIPYIGIFDLKHFDKT